MMTDYTNAAEALNRAELGTSFSVYPDGTYCEEDAIVPEALDYYGDPYDLGGEVGGWEAVHGLTGQHGYSGPILHESETLSAGVLAYLMQERSTPRMVALVPVVDGEHFYDPDYGEVVGWAVLIRQE